MEGDAHPNRKLVGQRTLNHAASDPPLDGEAVVEHIGHVQGEAVVGRTYLVPCFEYGGLTWPVLLPAHDDPVYFPTLPRHCHVDLRFTTAEQVRRLVDHRGNDWTTERLHEVAPHWILSEKHGHMAGLRPLQCLRPMPVFPVRWTNPYGLPQPYDALAELERDHASVPIRKGCRACPHRGIALSGLPVTDGVVVCPGHGLAWRVDTGELVPRVTGGAS